MTNKPEKKIRSGSVTATIWKNSAARPDGSTGEYYTISLERSYKDKSGQWANTNSLRTNDLPKAVLVLNKAYEFLTLRDASTPTGTNEEPEVEEI